MAVSSLERIFLFILETIFADVDVLLYFYFYRLKLFADYRTAGMESENSDLPGRHSIVDLFWVAGAGIYPYRNFRRSAIQFVLGESGLFFFRHLGKSAAGRR